MTNNKTKLTFEDFREYSLKKNWRITMPDGESSNDVFDSYASIEYKYFEGFNLPYLIDKDGNIESFEFAYKRMKDYYENIPIDLRKILANPISSALISYL